MSSQFRNMTKVIPIEPFKQTHIFSNLIPLTSNRIFKEQIEIFFPSFLV